VIGAVICDFGGVLTTPLVESFAAYQRHSGVALEDLGRAMAASTERHGGEHPLYLLEKGEITEDEFIGRLEAELDHGTKLENLKEVYFGSLHPNRPMIEFMSDLHGRGLRMALCTNNVREWEPLWRSKLPELDEIFEVVVDSAFVGTRKPEPQIYEITLARLGDMSPSVCVFIDDNELNCAAARELGMTAVHFRDAEQAIAEVEALLD
jgi:putative hydrolase of the HAD superfamily